MVVIIVAVRLLFSVESHKNKKTDCERRRKMRRMLLLYINTHTQPESVPFVYSPPKITLIFHV